MDTLPFAGTFKYAADTAGRVQLPPEWRAVLKGAGVEKIWFCEWLDGELRAFPQPAWDELMRRVRAAARSASPFDDEVRFVRHFLANAGEARVDSQGRLMIPDSLRETIDLKDSMIWVGTLDDFELWPAARWRERRQRVVEDARGGRLRTAAAIFQTAATPGPAGPD